MQGVRSGPGRVGSDSRVGTGELPDLGGRTTGGPSGVFPDRVSFGGGELIPGRAAAGRPAVAQLGQGESGASFPPLYQTGPPVRVVSAGSATA
jgi:hypothetical protein